MQPIILATGANPDFIAAVLKILPEGNLTTQCPPVYHELEQASSMLEVDYFLICLDQERDNSISTYRRVLRAGLFDASEIVIVGRPEACRVLAKEPLFLRARFFERPINVNDFRAVISTPIIRPEPDEKAKAKAQMQAEKVNLSVSHWDDEPDSIVNPKKHILIVDDELQQVLLIKGMLTGFYKVTAVTNGNDVRKYLSRHTTDLILLDYVMEGEDGISVFQSLKENPATADIPIIFLTAANDAQTVMSIIKLKPQGYLVKPVKRSDLISRIIDTLDSRVGAESQA
jgi:CheY-like chemotaxis protein